MTSQLYWDMGATAKAPGVRVSTQAGMARFIDGQGGEFVPTISRAAGGDVHWRFVGIAVNDPIGAASVPQATIIQTAPSHIDSNLANYPGGFTLDRCWIEGDKMRQHRRAVWFLGADQCIRDSVIKGVHAIVPTSDCVGVLFWNTVDRGLVDNCEIEGSSESVAAGGMDINPWALTRVPTDITVKRGWYHCAPYQWYLDPSFINVHWNTKNFAECKAARRLMWYANVFSDHIGQDQQFVFTIKSNLGSLQAIQNTADVIVQHAKLINCMAFAQVRGFDDDPNSAGMNRVVFDNVVKIGHRDPWPAHVIQPRIFQFQGFFRDVELSRITGVQPIAIDQSAIITEDFSATVSRNARVIDSIIGARYGISYPAAPNAGYDPGLLGERTIARNGFINEFSGTNYGDASNRRVTSYAEAKFVSYANSISDNMRLASDSPFKGIGLGGADPGADIDVIDYETRGCVSGVWA